MHGKENPFWWVQKPEVGQAPVGSCPSSQGSGGWGLGRDGAERMALPSPTAPMTKVPTPEGDHTGSAPREPVLHRRLLGTRPGSLLPAQTPSSKHRPLDLRLQHASKQADAQRSSCAGPPSAPDHPTGTRQCAQSSARPCRASAPGEGAFPRGSWDLAHSCPCAQGAAPNTR